MELMPKALFLPLAKICMSRHVYADMCMQTLIWLGRHNVHWSDLGRHNVRVPMFIVTPTYLAKYLCWIGVVDTFRY